MGPRVHNRSIFDPKISIFLCYTHITPIFGVRRIRPNGILSPPYPEVTLDNFSFLVGGRSAARRPVFRPPGRIFARKSVFCYRTPDFVNGPFVTLCEAVDLAPLDRFFVFSFPSLLSEIRTQTKLYSR